MLTQLLDVFSFLSVLLRGFALACQSLVIGGAIFAVWILKPLTRTWGSAGDRVVEASRRMLLWSALALALVQSCYVVTNSVLLTGTTGLEWTVVAGANFFVAGLASIASALVVVVMVGRRAWRPGPALLIPSLLILVSLVATSHAAGRIDSRAFVMTAGALHMLAAASWVGALAYLVLSLSRSSDRQLVKWICGRFSSLALASVFLLTAAGVAMSVVYIDSPRALYGTSYGVMLGAKSLLLGILLLLGGLNFLIVRRMRTSDDDDFLKLRRFVEAEVGIGFTVILAAASLSSQPPATDLRTDRLSLPEIVQRVSPQWPRLTTPPVSSLSPATPLGFDTPGNESVQSFVPGTTYQPNTPNDIAWSEYNHHWAGIIVLAVGLLALASRVPGMTFARHWPLAFLGLAVFLFLRADPENWPLGPRSFWQSFAVAEVLQHRIFVVLIIAFAIFEWRVATQRLSSTYAALVFPGVCAAGGAILLTHSHPLGNIKEELLAELSHVPLALCAVVAGWSRWLEIRAPGRTRQIVAWVWPVCFVMIGLLLLDYRES